MIKNLLIYILIPATLFLFAVILSIYFDSVSLSTISHSHKTNIEKENINGIESDKIIGMFTAEDKNLSIIRVKSKSDKLYVKTSVVEFKIKEKGQDWFYSNIYNIDTLKHSSTLLIGFPPVSDSMGKEYVFEIAMYDRSGYGYIQTNGAVSAFQSIYKYSKQEIINSPSAVILFVSKKLFYSFTDISFILSSLSYFLPFIAYIGLVIFKPKVKSLSLNLCYVVVGLIMLDVIFFNHKYYGVNIVLISLVILIGFFKKFNSSVYFLIGTILLALTSLFIFFRLNIGITSSSFYIYILYIAGAAFLVKELASQRSYKSIGIKEFLPFLFGNIKRQRYVYKNVFAYEAQLFRFELYNVVNIPRLFNNKYILDLGCGYGPDTLNIAKYAKKIVGVDYEKHDNWKEISTKKLKFVKANSQKLPFKNSEFQGVFLKDLLHHVDDVPKTMKELKRVTATNGKIIIIEGNRYNPLLFIYATKFRKHEHFTQNNFKNIVLSTFPNVMFISYEIYPPFFLKGGMYKLALKIYSLINRIKILRPFFSYNIAIVTNKHAK